MSHGARRENNVSFRTKAGSGSRPGSSRSVAIDPERTSATFKDTWLDRARRLPSVEFG
jgi:hypothetical protein